MATIVAAAGGGDWSDGGTWVGGVAPGAEDVARLDATSGNVTLDGPAAPCQAIDCDGYTGTLTVNNGTLAASTSGLSEGAYRLRFSAGMTLAYTTPTGSISLGNSSDPQTLVDCGGKSLSSSTSVTLTNCTLAAAFSASCVVSLAGTFTSGGYAITNTSLLAPGLNSTVNLGASTVTCSYWSGSIAHTLNAGTSNIIITQSNTGLVSPLGKTFNDVTFTRGGTYSIFGANTIGRILLSGAAAATTIRFQHTTTHTLTGSSPFPSGTSGNVLTIESCASNGAPSAGSTATISKATGPVACDYLSLKDNTATGGATFYEGANSSEVSNVSGWTAGAQPATTAAFSGTPLSGSTPLSVVFTDASTDWPTSWLWEKSSDGGSNWSNFASGHTSQNPTESFTTGTWAVRLTATNAGGSDGETKLAYVTVTAAGGAGVSALMLVRGVV